MQKINTDNDLIRSLIDDLNRAEIPCAGDQVTRTLYSTDASIYQVMPVAVAWPRDTNQVSEAVEIAQKHAVPLLPRGGGSSLAGQAVGEALILDFSRYMDQILAYDPQGRSVEVQPGVILGSLNRQLAGDGLTFGPDPASADRATVGGVLGNNATGAHSILYGMAHDHILEAEAVLSDAGITRFNSLSPSALAAVENSHTLAGKIYREIPPLIARYQPQIAVNFPNTFRNVAGYNLRALAAQDAINPAILLAGAEGTLGLITAARLNLVPLPRYKILYLLHFDELHASLACVPEILESGPSAIELVDRMLIRLARANPAYRSLLNAVQGDPEGVLIVEYQGEELEALKEKKNRLTHLGPLSDLVEPEEQEKIWKARKVGLGILQSQRGDAKPTTFIEDAAVPVEHLADYALELKAFAGEIGVGEIAFYAHASAGCLHVRPQVNLKSAEGVRQMRALAEKSLSLVIRFGGTTSGEHGEGFARGEFSRQLFGPELTQAFQEVKEIFDPEYIFNPGKIINPPKMDHGDLMRYGPLYQASQKPENTLLCFEADQGFDRAVEMCNGAGVCRQLEGGVMCPSFQATRDEQHSTRGRANMLRAAMTGKLGPGGMISQSLYHTLDLCLSCQACLNECPSTVDMSKLKAEFLHQYYQAHGVPFRSWFFANIAGISKLAQPFSALINPILNSPFSRLISLVGIHTDRSLPAFARQTFTQWYRKEKENQHKHTSSGSKAVFFYDTYLEYNYPHIGQALVHIFDQAGLDLIILEGKEDSGRPGYSKGVLDKAQALAKKNLELLLPYAEEGIPIIGCEPSVVVMLTKEYLDLVPGDAARKVAGVSLMAEDFLLQEINASRVRFQFDHQPRQILYHGHCQQKANFGAERTLTLLRGIPGAIVEQVEAGCCGMAGAFGYEKEHYALSMEIAELSLAPQIRESGPETIICASGTSCREQIGHTTDRNALHPLEVFASALA